MTADQAYWQPARWRSSGTARRLVALSRSPVGRFVKFGLVGGSGLVVNTAFLAFCVEVVGATAVLGVILATQVSTTWNFFLTERLVFHRRAHRHSRAVRYVQFSVINNSTLLVRGPAMLLLTRATGMNYLWANVVTLLGLMVIRFAVADRLIWPAANSAASSVSSRSAETHLGALSDDEAIAALTEGASDLIGEDWPLDELDTAPLDELDTAPLDELDTAPLDDRRTFKVIADALLGAGIRPLDQVPGEGSGPEIDGPRDAERLGWKLTAAGILAVGLPAILLRVWAIAAVGLNSDEAVYAGQAASIAGHQDLMPYFPIFRAHPLLFHTAVSLVFRWELVPVAGRLVAVAFGLGTVAVTYLLGKELYGRRAGFFAALVLAVMPYHVVVTRQILLDGPQVFFSTTALLFLAKFAATRRTAWLYSSAVVLGLTFLTNERSIVLVGSVYAFLALTSAVRIRLGQAIIAGLIFIATIIFYPISLTLSDRSETGGNFLAWQLFRKANHTFWFYMTEVPPALGLAVVVVAIGGLWFLRRSNSWREALLLIWMAVPFALFQLWPVKGFQYLLPLAPPVAVLAGRAFGSLWTKSLDVGFRSLREPNRVGRLAPKLLVLVALFLTASVSWGRINPSTSDGTFLAGSGGVPRGREAGEWVKDHVPVGSRLLAVGPSMANIIQFYGDRKTFGLSVSPNPLHRNPVYEPIVNPDLQLRNSELHYLVWDSFSADRTKFFSEKLLVFAERFHGQVVHTEYVDVPTASGETTRKPVIVIYQVRP